MRLLNNYGRLAGLRYAGGGALGAISCVANETSKKPTSYQAVFGPYMAFPVGYSDAMSAIIGPVKDSGFAACRLIGEGFLTIDAGGIANAEATLTGEGFIVSNENLATNAAATLIGEGVLTVDAGGVANAQCTMDAGARPSAFDIAQEIVATSADGSVTISDAFKLFLAVLVGKVSKAGNIFTFRDVNDTKDRVVATTTVDGERTDVTKDVS